MELIVDGRSEDCRDFFFGPAPRGATRGLLSLKRETVELMELIKLLVVHQVPKTCLHAHKTPLSKRFSAFKKHLKSRSG